jgi:hypothetical protein
MNGGGLIVLLIVRIIAAIYCSDKAGKLNRSTGSWGFFGFITPIIAFIAIQFMKPIIIWETEEQKK